MFTFGLLLTNTKTMHKITNNETGFKQYMNAKDAARFIYKNGTDIYKVEKIRSFDYSNLLSFIAFLIMMSIFTLGFIYFATN